MKVMLKEEPGILLARRVLGSGLPRQPLRDPCPVPDPCNWVTGATTSGGLGAGTGTASGGIPARQALRLSNEILT